MPELTARQFARPQGIGTSRQKRQSRLRYWALMLPGPKSKRCGYVLDVYPEEAARYWRNLPKAIGRRWQLLGEFSDPETATEFPMAAMPA
jgi:hypothetical protein